MSANGFELHSRERKAQAIVRDILRHLTPEERTKADTLLAHVAGLDQATRDAWAKHAFQASPSPKTWARVLEILRECLEADAKAPRCPAQYQLAASEPVLSCVLHEGHDGIHCSGGTGWPEWASARRVG